MARPTVERRVSIFDQQGDQEARDRVTAASSSEEFLAWVQENAEQAFEMSKSLIIDYEQVYAEYAKLYEARADQ